MAALACCNLGRKQFAQVAGFQKFGRKLLQPVAIIESTQLIQFSASEQHLTHSAACTHNYFVLGTQMLPWRCKVRVRTRTYMY